MEEYGLSSGRAGILISLFFLAIMAGLCIEQDCADAGTAYLYDLLVADSLRYGNYFW